MRVVFSNRAYVSVLAETTEKIKTETGGLFLGVVRDDTWYVIEAIDPGPKSVFEVAYFEYDQKYTQHLINKIANLYEQKLSLIGLWHRHPGSFDQFSSTDDGTNAKYAAMRPEGAISALVNVDPTFRITMYQVNSPCWYKRIAYDVGDNLIPDDLLRYKTQEQFFSIMENLLHPSNTHRNAGDYHKSASLSSFINFILPQMRDSVYEDVDTNNLSSDESDADLIIEAILDDLTFMADTLGIETAITLDEGYLTIYQEAIDKTTKLFFAITKEKENIIFTYEDKCFNYSKSAFENAFMKAKAEKDNAKGTDYGTKGGRSSGNSVLDSVIRIIRFNRNED